MRRTLTLTILTALAVAGAPSAALAAPPANDAFANRTTIAGTSGSIPGSNVDATRQSQDPCPEGWCGERSVWYRWTPASNGTLTVQVASTEFDTLLGVYTGSSLVSLSTVDENNDHGESTDSRVVVDVVSGTAYTVFVDGNYDEEFNPTSGSFTLTWSQVVAPANDDFAAAQVLAASGTGTVSGTTVGASRETSDPCPEGRCGTRSVWYRWTAPTSGAVVFDTFGSALDTLLGAYTDGSFDSLSTVAENDDAPGSTRSRITFDAVAGTIYRVVVIAKDVGFETSPGGTITLNWAMAPVNDHFAAASSLLGASGSVNGSTAAASAEFFEPAHVGQPAHASIWFSWQAPANGATRFHTTGSNFDTVLAVYTGSAIDSLTEVASNNDFGGAATSSVTMCVSAGVVYRIAVDGFAGARGAVTLAWGAGTPANDDFANARQMVGAAGSFACENANATRESGEPQHAGRNGNNSVWFRWTAPGSGTVIFQTAGSLDTQLAVYTGSAVGSLTLVVANDDIGPGTKTSEVNFAAVSGTTYRIALDSLGTPGAYTLAWFTPTAVLQETGPGVAHWWALAKDSKALGGSYRVARERGATLTFPFSGKSIALITYTGPQFGKAKVKIDGAVKGTLDLYSKSLVRKVHKTFKGLSNGSHTITIEVLGKKNSKATDTRVVVDGFKDSTRTVNGPAGTMVWSRVANAGALGGTYATASIVGAALSVAFTGTELRLNYVKTPHSGRAQIIVNGTVRATIDAYAASTRFGVMHTITGLAPGSHTAVVRVLGTRRAASKDTQFAVDRWIAV